jgi:hypothetical protein
MRMKIARKEMAQVMKLEVSKKKSLSEISSTWYNISDHGTALVGHQ